MLERIGQTPLIRSESLSSKYGCTVYIKEDFHNPGMSSKDRIAHYMIREAAQSGILSPGGTVVEASSGNTGLGLAMIARTKGYSCHIFVSNKCSAEKISLLERHGATVTICTNSNGFSDPGSTQARARRYADRTPGAFFCNQYFNPANTRAHYETTGPEIWEQSTSPITHFIAGVGTGGTISGIGRYLKEQNPAIRVWGIDPCGSILTDYFNHGTITKPGNYLIEGIGRNFIPGTLDFDIIDRFIQVDEPDAVLAAHVHKRDTGFLSGFSSAAVMAGLHRAASQQSFRPQDTVVLFFADHGSRYLSKLYNEQWLYTELNIALEERLKAMVA